MSALACPRQPDPRKTVFLFRGKNREFGALMNQLCKAEETKPLGGLIRVKRLLDLGITIVVEEGAVTLIDGAGETVVSAGDVDRALAALCNEVHIGNLASDIYLKQLKQKAGE